MDEEEQKKLEMLSNLRATYKEEFNRLRQLKLDIDYCDKLVHQCRQKIMNEFDNWYLEEYVLKESNKV